MKKTVIIFLLMLFVHNSYSQFLNRRNNRPAAAPTNDGSPESKIAIEKSGALADYKAKRYTAVVGRYVFLVDSLNYPDDTTVNNMAGWSGPLFGSVKYSDHYIASLNKLYERLSAKDSRWYYIWGAMYSNFNVYNRDMVAAHKNDSIAGKYFYMYKMNHSGKEYNDLMPK
jgi:hypothetical protein